MHRHDLPFCSVHPTLSIPSRFGFAGWLPLLFAGLAVALPIAAQTTNKQAQINALNAEKNDAMDQVRKIVNQPVRAYARKPDMDVGRYPYWFHDGANTPDFDNVDVRTTQEKIYDKFEYVSSDLNPNVVFPGRDLEFNANTKLFYTDRSLPKKKLTEPQMLEINRLYRIIGRCNQQLAILQPPPPAPEAVAEDTTPETASEKTAGAILTRFPVVKSGAFRVTIIVLGLLGIVYLFRRRSG